jgi:hemolysin III
MDFLRDPVSSSSHFIAAILALVATLFLYRLTHGDPARRLCVLVFGGSMTLVFAASALYHAVRLPPDELRIFQQLDMSAIYLMIAGSCTPIVVILLTGRFRMWMLAGQWLLAAIGIASLWLLPKPDHAVLVTTYLGMGWLGTLGIWHYWRATGWRGIAWVMTGAAFYTLGAAIELAQWPVVIPGVVQSHELLHFCDIAGSACHLVFISAFVLPYQLSQSTAAAFPVPAIFPAEAAA